MSQFYKMDPADWDFGTSGLSLEEEAAYLRIINAIHKHDAPVPNNDRVLAGLFRSSTRKARALLTSLLAAGKVTIEDGAIWNDRARLDLVQRGFASLSRAESGVKGGRARAENAAKSLANNNKAQAIASTRIEKNREEDAADCASVRDAEKLKGEDTKELENESPTFRERILTVIRVDPVSGLTGKGGAQLGSRADMHEAQRWLNLPRMSEALILEEVRRIMDRKSDGPPNCFGYFTSSMQKLSGMLSLPPLQATTSRPQRGDPELAKVDMAALLAGINPDGSLKQ